jgi:L-Ala-D/L-Glu epimerase
MPVVHASATVELRVATKELALAEAFGIARGSRTSQTVVHVELEHEGVVGRGEASAVYYRGESVDAVVEFLSTTAPPLVGDDPFALEDIEERLEDVDGLSGGKSALDAALHDWIGKRLGVPLWRLLGLAPRAPHTSFTIGIDTVDGTRDRVRRAGEFRALKAKVGGAEDLERLEVIREEAPGAALRVDANEGWTLDAGRDLMPELIRLGVEFVEQPFPAADIDSFNALKEVHPRLPVIVDEGCQNLADVAPAAAYADGINVKLAKSGGVREAVRMIHAARALNLHVMLGCMVESQLGVAPAAALASLADWVDLDGHLLLADQPFTGLRFEDGRVLPSGEPGLGVSPA